MTAKPGLEQRSGRDRRRGPGGRPREIPECAIDWAQQQISDGRSHRDVAAQLQMNRRTLDRRLADRQNSQGLLVRCHCGATTREKHCPNGHAIPLFLPHL